MEKNSQCVNGTWNPPIPDCTCPSLTTGTSVSVVCSFNDNDVTNCTEPLPGVIATMKCPSIYFNAKQSLICDSDGVWRSLGPFNQCNYQCGNFTDDIVRWGYIVRNRSDDANLCHATLLNSVYAITAATCVDNFDATEIVLWDYTDNFDIQAIENAGKFKLIRMKRSIQMDEITMPICLKIDEEIDVYDKFTWPRDPIKRCRVSRRDHNGVYLGSNCPVDDAECIYTYGSAFYQQSKHDIEGIRRKFLYGIGRRAVRKGENIDGVYECHYNESDVFNQREYIDLDFSNHARVSAPINVAAITNVLLRETEGINYELMHSKIDSYTIKFHFL